MVIGDVNPGDDIDEEESMYIRTVVVLEPEVTFTSTTSINGIPTWEITIPE